eukprot:963528-Rhodomonas_salina.1
MFRGGVDGRGRETRGMRTRKDERRREGLEWRGPFPTAAACPVGPRGGFPLLCPEAVDAT